MTRIRLDLISSILARAEDLGVFWTLCPELVCIAVTEVSIALAELTVAIREVRAYDRMTSI